jgi:AcrR family transcriptional regulator
LLAIAAEMFATRGYTLTTVRDIADEAGILSGSLYHHFSSKEAMLTEILQEFMSGLYDGFVEIAESRDSPREILDGLIRRSFETIHRSPYAVALYQNESAFLASVPDFAFVTKTGRKIEKLWIAVLDDGRKSGAFRKDLDVKLVYRFIRDSVWASVQWYRPGGRLGHATVADQFLDLLHGGLLTR